MEKKTRLKIPEQDYLLECFDYNPELGDFFWRERPREHFKFNNVYMKFIKNCPNKLINTFNSTGYYTVILDGKEYLLHRLIWKLYYGEEPPNYIDHINGIRHDNRICNLREATQQQNIRNKNKLISNNISGYLGITYNKKSHRYRVSIACNYSNIYVGVFIDLNEARTRRVLLEKAIFGEFYAKTDDIEDTEYYKNYVSNLTEEQLKEYTTLPTELNKDDRISKYNELGFKGVSKVYNGKYRGHVTFKGKRYGTKVFNTPEEAALARENKLKELKSINTTET